MPAIPSQFTKANLQTFTALPFKIIQGHCAPRAHLAAQLRLANTRPQRICRFLPCKAHNAVKHRCVLCMKPSNAAACQQGQILAIMALDTTTSLVAGSPPPGYHIACTAGLSALFFPMAETIEYSKLFKSHVPCGGQEHSRSCVLVSSHLHAKPSSVLSARLTAGVVMASTVLADLRRLRSVDPVQAHPSTRHLKDGGRRLVVAKLCVLIQQAKALPCAVIWAK